MARCVHCRDGEHDDCRSPDCWCWCQGGDFGRDDDIEADEWDEIYGWGDGD